MIQFYLLIPVIFLLNIDDVFWGYVPFLHNFSCIAYAGMVIAWGESVRSRIIQPQTRHLLYGISWMLVSLFVIRLSRWTFFEQSLTAKRYFCYLYYIPFIFVPLFSFLAAVRLDEQTATPRPCYLRILTGIGIAVTGIVITNDLHGWMFWFDETGNDHRKSFYYVVLIWAVLLSLGSLVILLRCCRLPQCRKLIYVPLVMGSAGILLLAVFMLNGSSPTICGEKLFYVQEAYALIYIGMWEGCILIGLLPSNMSYRTLFSQSHISAEMTDMEQTVHYSSAQMQTSSDPEDLICYKNYISGGVVSWTENVHAIRSLREQIAEAAESIAEENTLIEEEHRINAEHMQTETMNRLYDRIAAHSHPQLAFIAQFLPTAESFTAHLPECILFGTYVKRNANLMLLAGKEHIMSVRELELALQETMNTLGLLEIECILEESEPQLVPAQMLVEAYDIAEAAAERVYSEGSVFAAAVMPDADTLLTIETDISVPEDVLRGFLIESGLTLSVTENDNGCMIRLGGVLHES